MIDAILSGVSALLITSAGTSAEAAPTTFVEVVDRLRERSDEVQSLICEFEQTVTPTPYFVARAAKDMDLPRQQIVDNYSSRSANFMVESSDGRYLVRILRYDNEGRPTRKDTFAYDGQSAWKQVEVPLDGDESGERFRSSKTEVGGDRGGDHYVASISPARFLGDAALPDREPLFALMEQGRGGELLERESVDGDPCVVVRWRSPAGSFEKRTTAWLDVSHNLVLRRYLEEYNPPESGWIKTMSCEASGLGETRFRTNAGKATRYYYPKAIIAEVYNADEQEETFVERYDFEGVRINPKIGPDTFALQIDEGTGVLDLDTGQYSVYGSGPGPKLNALIDQRVAEARRQAHDSGLQKPPGSQKPPVSPATYGMWAALALGVVGLVSALALKIRGLSKS